MRGGEGETKISAMDVESSRGSAGDRGARRDNKYPGGIMVTTQVDVRDDTKMDI